jgi:hypothetical protein
MHQKSIYQRSKTKFYIQVVHGEGYSQAHWGYSQTIHPCIVQLLVSFGDSIGIVYSELPFWFHKEYR